MRSPAEVRSPADLIAERVREAAAARTSLRIRGGGSKEFLAESLEGEVLSTASLSGVRDYEPSELFVTVGAGTPLAELELLLAAQGQCLPFEPPRFGGPATVGGMVASGLSGPARASVGPVRDYVLGLTLVNGSGELLTFGGQVMKNVAGYDVSRLMAGAFGTLGLIAEVSLKVLPKPAAETTLRFAFSQTEALRRLGEWGGRPLPLNASCWVDDGATGTLYLRLRGAAAAVESACRSLGGERLDDASTAVDWTLCRDQALPWFQELGDRDLWRLSVPRTAPELALPDSPLVEWHGAQRWVRASARDGAWLREIATRAGGHATLFRRGPETLAREPRFTPPAPPLDRIQRELRRQFDPAGIFNRGWITRDS